MRELWSKKYAVYSNASGFFWGFLHPWKPTWQWKNHQFLIGATSSNCCFHCHVSFRGLFRPKNGRLFRVFCEQPTVFVICWCFFPTPWGSLQVSTQEVDHLTILGCRLASDSTNGGATRVGARDSCRLQGINIHFVGISHRGTSNYPLKHALTQPIRLNLTNFLGWQIFQWEE